MLIVLQVLWQLGQHFHLWLLRLSVHEVKSAKKNHQKLFCFVFRTGLFHFSRLKSIKLKLIHFACKVLKPLTIIKTLVKISNTRKKKKEITNVNPFCIFCSASKQTAFPPAEELAPSAEESEAPTTPARIRPVFTPPSLTSASLPSYTSPASILLLLLGILIFNGYKFSF